VDSAEHMQWSTSAIATTTQYCTYRHNAAVNGKQPASMNKGKIMRKFLGQTSTTANETESVESSVASSQLRPSASQNTVHSARAPITCLDRSPDGNRAVIAGSKIFKTLQIDGSIITEDVDLRSIIASSPSCQDISGSAADQLNIRAVKWLHGNLDSMIVTACGNGRIVLYDLNRAGEGLAVARIQGHARQVHELAVNPFRCDWLLSASQDGTVKSFDLRVPSPNRNDLAFRARHSFKCNADAVRDVKWSPIDGMEFACSTDAGVVLKWDIRKPSAPVLKITAHQSACFSIAWHPDGDHLVSGGLDQRCYVWDVSKKAERGQKARYSFSTPAPISAVSWRPAYWSATACGKRAAQVTVSYDESNVTRSPTSSVHLWDLARPAMPFKEIEQWDSAPTALLWNTRDLLWSVDRDGRFTQTDVAFVPQLIDRRSLSNFGFSANGDVLMLLEERATPRRPRPSLSSPEIYPGYQHNSPRNLFSISQSDSEEDVVGSFLGPRQGKRRHHHDSRSPQQLSTTPPNTNGMAEIKVMSLDEAVKVTGPYKPQQIMAIGHAPSTAKRSVYKYFTNKYLERMAKEATSEVDPSNKLMASITEYFARTAEYIGHYRLAQTWRLLGYTMGLLLTRRAEHHRQFRLTVKQAPSVKDMLKEPESPRDLGEETPRKFNRANSPFDSPLHASPRTLIREDVESTSNMATPLVRPIRDNIIQETMEAMQTPLVENDDFQLPDAAHSPSPSPVPIPGSSLSSSNHTESSAEGYDFYGLESYTPIDLIAPTRKIPLRVPLRLDYPDHDETVRRMQAQRHDSGESFQMFSTSGDSPVDQFVGSSTSDQDPGPSLRERVSSWESNFTPDQTHRAGLESYVPGLSDTSEEQDASASNEVAQDIPNGFAHNPVLPPVFRIQEASVSLGTGDDGPAKKLSKEPVTPSSNEQTSDNPNIIESDFLPWPNDPEFTIPPIDPAVLVQRCIDFEAQTGALNASAMVLLLRPFLPDDAIDEIQAAAILRQYQDRLNSMKLFSEAASLRNLCVPFYPSVFAVAQENINIGYFCTDCHKPLDNDPLVPNSVWRCPRCQQVMDTCSVCRQREPEEDLGYEEEDAVDVAIWWYCPGCGHGGHTSCMAAWHSGPEYEEGTKYSGGCCPLEGCLHPCLPGSWREQRAEEKKLAKQKELELLIKENSRQGSGKGRGVRRDAREVTQSKAVEGVRVALGLGGLERKKSVKVVAPGEED
jgi:WD40 repeat protein